MDHHGVCERRHTGIKISVAGWESETHNASDYHHHQAAGGINQQW